MLKPIATASYPPRSRWLPSWRRSHDARPAWISLFIPFALLIVVVVSVTGWLAFHNG
ncbi:MAG: hypothetical protein WBA10_21590 [Elainellaceae cyanobacterium]